MKGFCRLVFFISSPRFPLRCPQGHAETSKIHSEIRAEGQEASGSSLICPKVGGWPWASLRLPGPTLSICKMRETPGLSSVFPPQPESSELSSFIFPLHKRGKCVSKHCLFVEKCFLSWVCELSAEYKPVHLTEYLFRKFTSKYVSKHALSHRITQKHWFQARWRSQSPECALLSGHPWKQP